MKLKLSLATCAVICFGLASNAQKISKKQTTPAKPKTHISKLPSQPAPSLSPVAPAPAAVKLKKPAKPASPANDQPANELTNVPAPPTPTVQLELYESPLIDWEKR